MANLWITEYSSTGIPFGEGGIRNVDIAFEPAITDQKLSFAAATQSAPFSNATRLVRLVADADCHVHFGTNPVATSGMQPLRANVSEWRAVQPGQKLSAYDGVS